MGRVLTNHVQTYGLFPSFITANHLALLGVATMKAASPPLLEHTSPPPTQLFCLGELLSECVLWQE